MGQYNSTIITNAGQSMIAQAIAEGQAITITRAKTSSYQYPSGTNFQELTDLQDIQQTVLPSSAEIFNGILIQVLVSFSNESITEAYLIQNVGLYARLENGAETMIALCTAATPDQMPAYDNVAPSAFIYNIQITVSQAGSLTVQVNPAGTATVQQFLELQGTVNTIQQGIGILPELDTIEKDNLVEAVNELFERIPQKDNLLCNSDFASGIINTLGQSSYTSQPYGTIQAINGWQMTGEGILTVRAGSVLFACDTSAGIVTSFPALSAVQPISLRQGQSYTMTVIASDVIGTIQIKINDQMLDVSDGTYSLTWEQEEDAEAVIQITLATQSSTVAIYSLKLEQGDNFTGMPPWNEAEERIRCGLDASDTGWLSLPLASGITNGDVNPMYTPRYRKVGQTVYVQGLIKGVTKTGSNATLATLPEGYRPRNYRPKFVAWGERISETDTSTLAAFRIYDSGAIAMLNCAKTPTADDVYTLNFSFVI